MWRTRRRLRQLEAELARARAERSALSRRLELFEELAAQVGRQLPAEDAPPGIEGLPAGPVPPSLLAAARELRGEDVPVRLTVAGQDMVAVVGGPGDPSEWWRAIRALAGRPPGSGRPAGS